MFDIKTFSKTPYSTIYIYILYMYIVRIEDTNGKIKTRVLSEKVPLKR